jgi:hypothetical protein
MASTFIWTFRQTRKGIQQILITTYELTISEQLQEDLEYLVVLVRIPHIYLVLVMKLISQTLQSQNHQFSCRYEKFKSGSSQKHFSYCGLQEIY